MPWQYQCGVCRVQTEWGSREAAEDARSAHRARAHGGLIPTDETLTGDTDEEKQGGEILLKILGIGVLFGVLKWITEHL
ncbi:hypothetical protein ACF064_01605 [Streptomyces sp. NPDC015492]|uniref:hypothetical protein n=1 Tax=Streptomyces sp. NPDC015492 TaxID=3364958 RepID=UPI003700F653